jgi:omega-amidase
MAEKDLKITMVQSTLHWENADKNLYHFTQLLDNVKAGSTHLIVLPEMFTTGFSMQAKILHMKQMILHIIGCKQ